MSDSRFTLRIVTPEATVLDEEVVAVKFPGEDGLFGILPRHADMVALTNSGVLEAKKVDGSELVFGIHEGFAEMRNGILTILIRAAEKPAEIDSERAAKAAERARERLRSSKAEYDYARSVAALRRALLREKLARIGR